MERLTIGAFARRSGLSVSALRFYDRAGLLMPADVDPVSSYRIYDGHQLDDAELIRDLRRLEMPLAAIQTFLMADAAARQDALRLHLESMSARLRKAEAIADQLTTRITQEKETSPMTTMTVNARSLAEAIDQVTPAASTDPDIPALHTVLVEAREGTLRLVATDKYRLAVRDLVARGDDGVAFRAVVPSAELSRIGQTLGGHDQVEVTRHEDVLVVGADPAAGSMAALPAEFPAYEKLFVLDPDAHSVVVERTVLANALQSTLESDVLRLSLTTDLLRLNDDPPQELEVSYRGPNLTVGLNPTFVHYAVTSSVGPEVMIDITQPTFPVVFRSATDSSFICMVMPIKLLNAA